MTDAQDLARRYLALWEEYLTALFSDASQMEGLQEWVDAGVNGVRSRAARERAASGKARQPGPPADAPTADGAPGEHDDAVAELSQRIARLEERLAALERRGKSASRARGGNRRVRVG